MRVLIVDWYSPYVSTMELMLRSEGFSFYTTAFGEEAIDLAKTEDYDIILLELNLPDMSGIDVLRSIRLAKIDTPIMIVTGSAEIDLKVKSFSGGADDYLCRPFHKDELICRIHAIIRRSKGLSQSVIRTGEITLNLDTRTVEILGTKVNLTSTEYQMLEFLSLRKGTTLTKEMFLDYLYHGIGEPEVKTIDVFICKLRKKLASANTDNGNHYIETVWGRGYVLRDPEHSLAETAA